MTQKHWTLLSSIRANGTCPWENGGSGGEVSARPGTYCTSLSPLNTVIPLYAYDLLRTKDGGADEHSSTTLR